MLAEAEPDVAHLLAVVLAIVRLHVDDDEAAAGLEDAPASASARAGSGTWCRTSTSSTRSIRRRRSAAPRASPAAGRRARARAPRPRRASPPTRRRRSPGGRTAPPATRRARRRSRGRRRPSRVEEPEQRLGRRGTRRTARRAGVPLAGAPAKKACEAALRSSRTRARRRASCAPRPAPSDLAADDLPQAPAESGSAAASTVQPAGRLAARGHPAAVGQRLQVPADGRLRQLQHVAQLRDGQLVALEHQRPSPRPPRTRTRMRVPPPPPPPPSRGR